MNYEAYSTKLKIITDPKRMKIIDLLSCGEMCACDILEHFDFTQPTLSHHIKVLTEAGMVTSEKKGTWHHYSLNEETAKQYIQETVHLLTHAADCICIKEGNKTDKTNLGVLQ